MTGGAVPVLALVVATRGGMQLEAALAALDWAEERAVLDPCGGLAPAALPAGVRVGGDVAGAAGLGTAPWLLLLAEHELAPAPVAEAVAAAVRGGPAAWRVPVEVETLSVRLAARGAPVRLAPRAGGRVVLDRALDLRLDVPPLPQRQLRTPVVACRGSSVAAAVEALDAESRALAALLAQGDGGPGPLGLAGGPAAALARVLLGRAPAGAGLARWIAAVFAGYRVVLAQARLWEWRQTQPAVVREVA